MMTPPTAVRQPSKGYGGLSLQRQSVFEEQVNQAAPDREMIVYPVIMTFVSVRDD
jgi:hypothetical protein